jgi:hypothetical protein
MNQSLLDLHLKGQIALEEVLGRTTNLEEMRQMLTQAGINIG